MVFLWKRENSFVIGIYLPDKLGGCLEQRQGGEWKKLQLRNKEDQLWPSLCCVEKHFYWEKFLHGQILIGKSDILKRWGERARFHYTGSLFWCGTPSYTLPLILSLLYSPSLYSHSYTLTLILSLMVCFSYWYAAHMACRHACTREKNKQT